MTNPEGPSNESQNNNNRRRASDTYVPISLMVSTVGILSGLYVLVSPMFVAQVDIQNRLTKLETQFYYLIDKEHHNEQNK